jgi:ubiquinone/menaquinone biosynthesis C-methylase UbiE
MMVIMGCYGDRILPRIINSSLGSKTTGPLRARVCTGLAGDVVEIGFGSGINIPFYPAEVTSVAAIEPNDLGWRLAAERLRASSVTITRSGLDGQHLPFAANSFDSALSTWTLCTIVDVESALLELRRVLRPGGTFHFVEHGLAPDEKVRRWQHRLQPINKALLGGCHVTRQIADLITAAGFRMIEIECFYEPIGPKYAAAMTLGIAQN